MRQKVCGFKTPPTKGPKTFGVHIMMRYFTILVLVVVLTARCNSKQTEMEGIESCSFAFEIYQESSTAYRYNSKTGQLSKLITPFKDEPLFADTVVQIPKEQICKLMDLYDQYKVYNYPDQFKPESEIKVAPEPTYLLKFTYQGRAKEVTWKSNTVILGTKEATNLKEIINAIDSIILSTPEYKALPEGNTSGFN